MKHNDLISIIIPMYNARKDIIKTVNTLQNQTYKNIEIIIVDDGSTDDSYNLCKLNFENDKHIKIFHKKNGGVSSARNFGIKEAKGEYIQFVDSDDLVESTYCEDLLMMIKKREVDYAICSFVQIQDKNNINHLVSDEIYDKNDFIKLFSSFENPIYMNPPWNRMFKSEIIKKHKIKFDENISFGEDFIFNSKYLMFCRKIATTSKPLYNYKFQEGGLCNKKREMDFYYKNSLKVYEAYETLLLKNLNTDINKNLNTHFLFVVRNIIENIFENFPMDSEQRIKVVRDIVSKSEIRDRLSIKYKKNIKNTVTYLCIKFKLCTFLEMLISMKIKKREKIDTYE